MKRRDFVKGLAAVPLAAIAAEFGCTKSQDTTAPPVSAQKAATRAESGTTKQLNVVVHGMFAIVVDRHGQKKVSLRAPNVPSHVYKAQTFTVDPKNPQNLLPGWTYTVASSKLDSVTFKRGNDPNLSLNIGEPERLAIDVSSKTLGKKAPLWTVELPVPDDICGLRAAPANYFSPCITGYCSSDHTDNQTYKDNEMSFEQHCPLIYVLTYNQIPADETVLFSGNNQAVPFDSSAARLHLFAEPDTMPTPHGSQGGPHVDDAIKELNQLFEPPLTLLFWKDRAGDDFEVGRDSSVNCQNNSTVLLCEERSLYELSQSCNDFLTTEAIDHQYKKFLDLEAELEATADQPRDKHAKVLPRHGKQAKSVYEKLRRALPSNGKPPSNCMSLLCKQS